MYTLISVQCYWVIGVHNSLPPNGMSGIEVTCDLRILTIGGLFGNFVDFIRFKDNVIAVFCYLFNDPRYKKVYNSKFQLFKVISSIC